MSKDEYDNYSNRLQACIIEARKRCVALMETKDNYKGALWLVDWLCSKHTEFHVAYLKSIKDY